MGYIQVQGEEEVSICEFFIPERSPGALAAWIPGKTGFGWIELGVFSFPPAVFYW